jgi:hypothetical protein
VLRVEACPAGMTSVEVAGLPARFAMRFPCPILLEWSAFLLRGGPHDLNLEGYRKRLQLDGPQKPPRYPHRRAGVRGLVISSAAEVVGQVRRNGEQLRRFVLLHRSQSPPLWVSVIACFLRFAGRHPTPDFEEKATEIGVSTWTWRLRICCVSGGTAKIR